MLMGGNSGGGGKSGRSGGGAGSGDAGQPGEVVREANKTQASVIGGVVIKKGMRPEDVSSAHAELISQWERGKTTKDAAMKSLTTAIRRAGIKPEDYPDTGAAVKIERWLKRY